VAQAAFTAAEFFAGIGLVRLALESAGGRVVFANDLDPAKLRMYRDNFGDADFRLGDVHALDAATVPDADIFTASFPCTDLSIAGAMRGLNSGQSSAFWGFVRVLETLNGRRPQAVLLENVPGFLLSHGGQDLEAALLALNRLGYACDLLMADAAWFVPQSRLRLFVVGVRTAAEAYPFGLAPAAVRPTPLVEFMLARPQVRWSVQPMPAPPTRSLALTDILEALDDDHPAWWNEARVAHFMGQLSDRHAAVAEQMIGGATTTYAPAFRRVRRGRSVAELRTDGLAGCLRTPRGGSGRQILFAAGGGQRRVRLLTARECARLQGVPDAYRIDAPLNQALFGFGDAVCVPAVAWILRRRVLPALRAAAICGAGPDA
jgi:DNA (cytosine-5)-methyltransferase 1